MTRQDYLCMACVWSILLTIGYAFFTLDLVPAIIALSVSAVAYFGGKVAA